MFDISTMFAAGLSAQNNEVAKYSSRSGRSPLAHLVCTRLSAPSPGISTIFILTPNFSPKVLYALRTYGASALLDQMVSSFALTVAVPSALTPLPPPPLALFAEQAVRASPATAATATARAKSFIASP